MVRNLGMTLVSDTTHISSVLEMLSEAALEALHVIWCYTTLITPLCFQVIYHLQCGNGYHWFIALLDPKDTRKLYMTEPTIRINTK